MLSSEKSELPDIIDFNFHVRPILSDKCFKCHGPDKSKVESGLSFATKTEAFKPLQTDSSKYAIVPNDLNKSVLVDRIISKDETLLMPPPDSHLALSQYEKDVLIKWIEQGAKWKKHWSFIALQKSEIPNVNGQVNNAIDNFVLAQLESKGMSLFRKSKRQLLN